MQTIAISPSKRPTFSSATSAAVVSMPFFNPRASCYPMLLLQKIAQDAGVAAAAVPANIEFFAAARRQSVAEVALKQLSSEHFLADAVFLPLLKRWGDLRWTEDRQRYLEAQSPIGKRDTETLIRVMDSHLDSLARRVGRHDFVLLTATHFQLLPSILLAERLREQGSATKILLGGYFGSYEAAELILATHGAIDCIMYGEAEDCLGAAMHRAAAGERFIVRGGAHRFREFTVDHGPLLRALQSVSWLAPVFTVSLEASRGCYWDKCTFCNFNSAYDGKVKSHDPAIVTDEMKRLNHDFGQRRFQLLDTAVLKRFLTHLGQTPMPRQLDLFCELRPDVGRNGVQALSGIDSVAVQVGVESILEDHLHLMDKNQSVEESFTFLEACAEFKITPTWGVFIGQPKETPEQRRRLIAHLQNWGTLAPPKYVTEFELRPGSPLWDRRKELGLELDFPWRCFDAVIEPSVDEAAALVPSLLTGCDQETPAYTSDRDTLHMIVKGLNRKYAEALGPRHRPLNG
jgi:radical SAM superfamily enzyme YgiQ (UPF0313 family)